MIDKEKDKSYAKTNIVNNLKSDSMGKQVAESIWGSMGYTLISTKEAYKRFDCIFKDNSGAVVIEAENRTGAWVSDKFKWGTVHVPARKRESEAEWYCSSSQDQQWAILIPMKDVLRCLHKEIKATTKGGAFDGSDYVQENMEVIDVPIKYGLAVRKVGDKWVHVDTGSQVTKQDLINKIYENEQMYQDQQEKKRREDKFLKDHFSTVSPEFIAQADKLLGF